MYLIFVDALGLTTNSSDTQQSNQTTKTSKKTKKEEVVLKYNEDIDFGSYFKQSRAATTLTKATLDKYSQSQTTLPEDLHYDPDKLFRLFNKPKIMVISSVRIYAVPSMF
jgi:condensin complex subunit 2